MAQSPEDREYIEAPALTLHFPGLPSPTAAVQLVSRKKKALQGKPSQHRDQEEGCCSREAALAESWAGALTLVTDLGHAACRMGTVPGALLYCEIGCKR